MHTGVFPTPKNSIITTWWLNHPFEKYAQVHLDSISPRLGVKIPKKMLIKNHHHLAIVPKNRGDHTTSRLSIRFRQPSFFRYLLDPDLTKQRSVTLLGTYLPPSQRRVKVVSFKISSSEVQPTSCWKFSCGVTAPKTKMTMEKQPFKDVFPIKTDDVPWLC